MKKFVAIFLIFILIFSFTLPSYAKLIEGLDEVKPTNTFDPTLPANRANDKDDGGNNTDEGILNSFSQILADILTDFSSLITKPLLKLISIFPTIEGCIWGTQSYFQLTFFDSNNNGIAGTFRSAVGSTYNALRYLVASFYIIILVYLGIRMILSSIGKQKAHYKTLLQYWLTGLLLLFAFHWVMALIIWSSDTLTTAFATAGSKLDFTTSENEIKEAASGALDKIEDVASDIWDWTLGILGLKDDTGDAINNTATSMAGSNVVTKYMLSQFAIASTETLFPGVKILNKFILIIFIIIFMVFGLVITFTYFKRLLTIALLIILFPLVVLSYVFDKIGDRRAQTFGLWMKEFAVNVFVQPIHAFLLLIVAYVISNLNGVGITTSAFRLLMSLMALAIIPIGEKQIKSLFQITSNMGPGNGGIAGSVAHAGIAVKTLQSLGNSLVDMRRKGLSLKSAETFTKDIINKRGEKAYKNALKAGKSKDEAAKAKATAEKEFSEGLAKSAKYKKKMKELTGHTSIEKARKANSFKIATGVLGGSIGAGYALATTTSAGELIGNITKSSISGAAIGNTFGNTIHDFIHAGEPLESPELDEVEKWAKNDLSKLSEEQKKQMSEVLGINKEAINNSKESKDLIRRKIMARRKGLSYGLNYDDPNIAYLDEDYDEIQAIKGGWDPKDPSKKINWSNFKKSVTKDGMYLHDIRDDGKLYHIPDLANSKASEKIIWQDADESNEEFKVELGKRATTLADAMVDNGAFRRNSKEYKNFLKNEQKDMAEHYAAHIKTVKTLESENHNMLERHLTKMYSSSGKRIQTTDDIREHLTTEQLSDLNSSIRRLQEDLTFTPDDSSSRTIVLDAIKNLYNNGSKLSVTDVCAKYGVSYEAVENGIIDDGALEKISTEIQQRVGDEKFRIASANKIDINARANDTISSITNDGMISQKSIDFAINNATHGRVTSLTPQNLQTFLNNSTTTEKQHFIDTCNQLIAEEHIVSPHTATIVHAQREGKINTNVNVSNTSTDIAQLLGISTQTLGAFKVSPIDPNTQKSVVTFTANGDTGKTFTFQSDINTGGDINATYAGNVTVDDSGNVTLLRSDEELDYSFEEQASNSQSNYDEEFNDFTLKDLQSYVKDEFNVAAHNQFTVIKNLDICAIIDDATNTVLFVKDGLPSVTDRPTQFTVKADSDNNLKIVSTPFANVDVFNRYRLTNHSRDHENEAKLIAKLLGK